MRMRVILLATWTPLHATRMGLGCVHKVVCKLGCVHKTWKIETKCFSRRFPKPLSERLILEEEYLPSIETPLKPIAVPSGEHSLALVCGGAVPW